MALTTKKINDDTPSRVAHETRLQFNALLTAVNASTDYASLKSGIIAACHKLITTRELAAPPASPTV
jgi:hypothetical protein